MDIMNSSKQQKIVGWTVLFVALFISTFGLGFFLFLIALISTVILAAYLTIDAHLKTLPPSKYERLRDPNARFNFMAGYKPLSFANVDNNLLMDGNKNHQLDVFSGDQVVDEEISSIFKLFFRDYVYSWYAYISPDQEFPREVRKMMTIPIQIVCKRMRNIEKVNYFTHNLVDSFATHLRLFRQSIHRESELKIEEPNVDFLNIFFDLESKLDENHHNYNRGTICRDHDVLFDYFANVASVLLYLTLPPEHFNNRPLVSIIKSLAVNTVLLPLMDMLSDPDYVNQCIVWACTKSSIYKTVSTDSFLTIMKCTDSSDELIAIKELLVQQMALLRSRDTDQDTDDSFDVKQQLNSLNYLEGLINSRLKSLKEGTKGEEDISSCNDDLLMKLSDKLINLPFEVVLKNNIALSHFIEFMSGIGGQGYVFFYLNVEGYKFSAEAKLSSIRDRRSASICSNESGKSRNNSDGMSEDDLDKLDSVRAAAVNIYDTYLSPSGRQSSQKLMLSPEIVYRIQECLERDELSEELFDEAWNQCFEVMKDRECFYPAFQKSIGYIKMLQDLDLLRDKSVTEGVDVQSEQPLKAPTDDIAALLSSPDPEFMDIEPVYSTNKPAITGTIESTGIVREFGNCYAVYAITVESHRSSSGNSVGTSVGTSNKANKWCTLRRYSDFLSFHQSTISKFPQLSRITFPAKKTMNHNLDQEFLEERKQLLDGYLQQILRIFSNRKDLGPGFQEHVMKFLEPGDYKDVDKEKSGQFLTKTIDKLVLNPFKSVGDVMRSGSDNIRGKLTKLGSQVIPGQIRSTLSTRNIPGPSGSGQRSSPVPSSSRSSSLAPNSGANVKRMPSSASTSSLASTSSFGVESSKIAANVDLDTENNIPLRIMLLLMDEVFDLKSKNQWLRRRIVAVVRQIIQATSGDAINKRIVDFVEDSTSPEAIAGYLRRFKSNLWPQGYKAAPSDPNARSVHVKNRTRVMAKSFLISALSDDLKHIIGSETTRKGLLCVFEMFQNKTLNRRLILVLFESIITELFPENHFPEIFQRLHSINPKTGNVVDECSKWPPHLKFMTEAAFYEEPSLMKRSSSVKSWK